MRNFQKVISIITIALLSANLIISCITLINSATVPKENSTPEGTEKPEETSFSENDLTQIKRKATNLDIDKQDIDINNTNGEIKLLISGKEKIYDAIIKLSMYDENRKLITTQAIYMPLIDDQSYFLETIYVSSINAPLINFVNIQIVDGYIELEN